MREKNFRAKSLPEGKKDDSVRCDKGKVSAEVAASIPQAFHFRKENGIDGGLYYVFPSRATESIQNGGTHYIKVGVDFPTGDALTDMSSFNYEGSEEVLKLIDEWVKEHLPAVGKRFDSYCSPYRTSHIITFTEFR
jgi:sarcosine oxidase